MAGKRATYGPNLRLPLVLYTYCGYTTTRSCAAITNHQFLQPFFLLLTFGYKLIHQTKMVRLEDMDFSRGDFKGTPEAEVEDPSDRSVWRRLLGWLLLV